VEFFSPLGKLDDRSVYFTFRVFLFFKLSNAFSGSTGPIFTIFFYQIEGFNVNVVNPGQFFSIAQGTLPWQPILGKIDE